MILPSLSDGPRPEIDAPRSSAASLEPASMPGNHATHSDDESAAPAPGDAELRRLAGEIAELSPGLASALVSSGMRRLLANR